jgi:hypothetical protein
MVKIKINLCISKVSYALHTTLARQPKSSSLEHLYNQRTLFYIGCVSGYMGKFV